MRIIAGRYKGRRLASVRGSIRPTSERLRETLFDVLGGAVRDSSWLDLFAGSGAVGLEAMSRGAAEVVFNDRDPQAVSLLEKNLDLCGVEEAFRIWNKDAFVLMRQLSGKTTFDFIFLDPPYGYRRYRKLLDKLLASGLCGQGTTVILEVFKKQSLEIIPAGLEVRRLLEGGDNVIVLISSRSP